MNASNNTIAPPTINKNTLRLRPKYLRSLGTALLNRSINVGFPMVPVATALPEESEDSSLVVGSVDSGFEKRLCLLRKDCFGLGVSHSGVSWIVVAIVTYYINL